MKFMIYVVKPVMLKLNSLNLLKCLCRVADDARGAVGLKFMSKWDPAMEESKDCGILLRSAQVI